MKRREPRTVEPVELRRAAIQATTMFAALATVAFLAVAVWRLLTHPLGRALTAASVVLWLIVVALERGA